MSEYFPVTVSLFPAGFVVFQLFFSRLNLGTLQLFSLASFPDNKGNRVGIGSLYGILRSNLDFSSSLLEVNDEDIRSAYVTCNRKGYSTRKETNPRTQRLSGNKFLPRQQTKEACFLPVFGHVACMPTPE